jgi:hypothetical protein
MTKGIYIQLLSRHTKKSENSIKRSTSSNSNNTNLSKFADNILDDNNTLGSYGINRDDLSISLILKLQDLSTEAP